MGNENQSQGKFTKKVFQERQVIIDKADAKAKDKANRLENKCIRKV